MRSPLFTRTAAVVPPEEFIDVCAAGDVKPGHPRAVMVDGRELAVFHVDGRFYAVDNACAHQGVPLVDGWVDGATVTCTWHAWCFSLVDGTISGRFRGVDAFEVREQNGRLLISRAPRPPAITA